MGEIEVRGIEPKHALALSDKFAKTPAAAYRKRSISACNIGDPGRIRTCDPMLRSKKPPVNQGPELRPHDPSLSESAYNGMNDFGRWLGPYPDLGQRTLDTLNLLSLPSLLSLMGPGAMALKASDAAAPVMAEVANT